ncbi:WD40-repeat-containing domain protein [Calycina marina]|uniref:WD40-repeat-containing domain protein n=1 Tax=Calycina marina TaxID=1763456 RepID=A0A9P7Z4V7_9HELO|nr:WD40-repeat-containing domain protein [Calycina marina]
MARVFPLDEWAAHKPIIKVDATTDTPGRPRTVVNRTDPRFRSWLVSLPLTPNVSNMSDSLTNLTIEGAPMEEKPKGIRGLLRRASISFKEKTSRRRHSHASQERPMTPWRNRLGEATSFNRHSRLLDVSTQKGFPELLAPIPGNATSPPVIPRGSGGAQARAMAAAQNEIHMNQQSLSPYQQLEDRESGIGIALTTTEPASCDVEVDALISRVDFINNLPAELAIQVLAHLDHAALFNTMLVSKSWHTISKSPHIWREVYLRDKSKTFATGRPITPGMGQGMPAYRPDNPWKALYQVKQELDNNWREGKAEPVYLNGHSDSIYCIQFDENKIITGSRDKTIRVWNMKTYACELVIGPPEVIMTMDAVYAGGRKGELQHFAMLSDQRRLLQVHPQTTTFDIHHLQSILCLQYDEEILITGSSDSTCIIYDIKNNYQPIRRLEHHTAAVLDLAFDATYIVTCSKDLTICVWDRKTGHMLKQLRGHTGPVNAVQMRGSTIVSCSGDFRVKLWNIDTGKNIREFSGHTKGLACSQFSEDSKYIASAGNDKIIRIWDANTGECIRKIEAHENLVRSLHIDSVSGRLVSGSYDQDIKVFDMETGGVLLAFPKWHSSWVLGAKSDYRRIISTGQDPKILIMDFGANVGGIEMLESL